RPEMSAWRLPFDVEGGDEATERRRHGLIVDADDRFGIDAAELRPRPKLPRGECERRLRSAHPILGKIVCRRELPQLRERRAREILVEVVPCDGRCRRLRHV